MPYIGWQDWMAVGVPMVDADHKVLISLINQVHDCIGAPEERANLGSVLSALYDYTDYHFQREERLQEEIGYPALPAHRKMHAALTNQVKEINQRYLVHPESVQGADVLTFLERWLIDHILTQDMAFRRFALGKPEAEQTARASVDLSQRRGAPATEVPQWGSLSVVVVDDNLNFLTLMDTILNGVGMALVRTAKSAAEALDLLAVQPADVVITDRYMAEMDGFEFIDRMRKSANPGIAGAAVLMISGRGDDDIRQRALAVGADEFMEKPIAARDMLAALARIVSKRRH